MLLTFIQSISQATGKNQKLLPVLTGPKYIHHSKTEICTKTKKKKKQEKNMGCLLKMFLVVLT